jgi:hypothetical protein
VTADVAKRLVQHNAGQSKWTAKHGTWKLEWSKGPMTLSAARQLESLLKRQKGGDGFFNLTGLPRSSGHAPSVVPPLRRFKSRPRNQFTRAYSPAPAG